MATFVRPPEPVRVWVQAHADSNTFAESLRRQLARYGTLSEGQILAVERGLRPSAVQTDVAGAGFDRLHASFLQARESGLKNPKVHVGPLRFTLAKDDSRNPGHLYVKVRGEYAGKISEDGVFSVCAHVPVEDRAFIEAVARDPLAAAIEHGHKTGNCAICAKALTDPESVQRGIGPICARRFGWL